MHFKRKLWILAILALLLWLCIFFLPVQPGFIKLYDNIFYYPFQSGRIILFGFIPFSIGDVVYILAGAGLLLTIVRWVYYLRKFGAYKERLAASMLRTLNIALGVYLWFFLGWGANYNKPPLAESWGLHTDLGKMDTAVIRSIQLSNSIAFNKFLVERLNTTAPAYRTLPFTAIADRAKAYYRIYTASKVKENGLGIKPTMFGFFMERMAVEGYYNPFTGEGQVNKELPAFILPFVVSHEMAHQAGIAAEGDANLMAYALGTAANDRIFNYSAYLELWLYANARLFRRDSVLAQKFEAQLNPLTRAHLDTLDQIDRKYHNEMSRISTDIYDSYLHMQNQKDGIRSYGSVASAAWQLELKRRNGKISIINIP